MKTSKNDRIPGFCEQLRTVSGFWLPVPETDGRYFASIDGQIRTSKGAAINPYANGNGYLRVDLTMPDGSTRKEYIHRLILLTFSGEAGRLQCAHLNGDKTDNRLVNLAWVTADENTRHKAIHGTIGRGETASRSKLTDSRVRQIREQLARGDSYIAVAGRFGVTRGTIRDIAVGRTWRHLPADELRMAAPAHQAGGAA